MTENLIAGIAMGIRKPFEIGDVIEVFAESFADSSVNLLVWFWIDYPGHVGFMQSRHKAVHLIHKSLAENDILIPFPIRTLDFGIKGGEKLNAMLSSKEAK